jgi:hypothetical protein
LHFGLGESASADKVRIVWPSGITQQMEHVRGDRIVTVEEPTAPAGRGGN